MYRNVNELNENELNELRNRLYYQLLDEGTIVDVFGKEIDSEEEISMDFIKYYYSHTSFVEEDFWCNLTE